LSDWSYISFWRTTAALLVRLCRFFLPFFFFFSLAWVTATSFGSAAFWLSPLFPSLPFPCTFLVSFSYSHCYQWPFILLGFCEFGFPGDSTSLHFFFGVSNVFSPPSHTHFLCLCQFFPGPPLGVVYAVRLPYLVLKY